MSLLHFILLALVQGVTEFLPVSSSAHLVLLPRVMHEADQGLLLDVAVHVGTLGAVLTYFRRDVSLMTRGFFRLCIGKKTENGILALKVILATLPVVLAGFFLHMYVPGGIRNLQTIALTTIIFGGLLWWADREGEFPEKKSKTLGQISVKQALGIGCAQVLALVPGVSRSGITMTAARFFGFSRTDSARFSLFLSVPTIAGAGTLAAVDLYKAGNPALTVEALGAALLAYIAALGAIALMMRWLQKASFTPFVIYRIVLGGALLVWIYA